MCCKEPVCALTGAEKLFDGATVLGPLDLQVRAGEVLGVRGPNGAGKSTLLGLMAGVLRPDRGACVRSAEAQAATAYLPQGLSLYPSLTGLENLKFWGLAWGLPGKAVAARSRWLLQRLDLADKGRQRVSAYSGGMQRRLHLATALMVTPKLLLLDEPTVGADAHSAGLILDMVEHLRDMGSAVVLVSHRAGDLERVCGRILTLEKGRLTGEAAVL